MKINSNGWTIVLAGNWNRHILSPEWAAKHIFAVEKLKVEFALNIALAPRFSSPDVAMMPSENAVVFMPLQQTDECLLKTEQFVHNLINKLPYTPMSAFGINFSFIENNPDSDLLALFNIKDGQGMNDFGCEVRGSGIIRQLQIEGTTLNLSIGHSEEGISFDFNFHYDVSDAARANELLEGQAVANKVMAYRMLSEIYHLEVEE
ncbi:MAG: hypothetical protein HYV06_04645 [Deltaproteobacteria bacterium]|nr:hypothetical protein [Deltaproteobacteria bacterium]